LGAEGCKEKRGGGFGNRRVAKKFSFGTVAIIAQEGGDARTSRGKAPLKKKASAPKERKRTGRKVLERLAVKSGSGGAGQKTEDSYDADNICPPQKEKDRGGICIRMVSSSGRGKLKRNQGEKRRGPLVYKISSASSIYTI